jgi:uncharacterized protein (DUF2267 family)
MAVTPGRVVEYARNNDRHDVIRAVAHTLRRQLKDASGSRIRHHSMRLSGKLWGIRTGLSNTIQGRVCNAIASHNSDIDTSRVDWNQVQQLKQDKYLVLEDHFDDELIETIHEQFEQYIEDDEESVIRGRHGDLVTSRCIHHPPSKIPALQELVDDTLMGIAEGFFGAHFRPVTMRCMRNYHVPEEIIEESDSESFADYWHCDQHPVDAIKVFISLHDLDDSHGPLHVVRADESAEISKRPFERHHHGVPGRYVEDNATVETFTGPAGSAAFAKTNEILHRASNPAEGNHRDVILLYGYATDQPLPDDWFDQIEPEYDKNATAMFGESN